MSTRATYLFKSNGDSILNRETCIYIHYDGYPEGAARYLLNMIEQDNKRGCMASQFLRANPLAELTTSHESHGDTEFRYTFTFHKREKGIDYKHGIIAEKRNTRVEGWMDKDDWETFHNGSVEVFVNKYTRTQEAKNMGYEPPQILTNQWGDIVTLKQFKSEIQEHERTLGCWVSNDNGRVNEQGEYKLSYNEEQKIEEVREMKRKLRGFAHIAKSRGEYDWAIHG